MLYIIGLGLASVEDLSLKAVQILKQCSKIYVDSYTSFCIDSLDGFEALVGKPYIEADREIVEQSSVIISDAQTNDIGFCVIGDPFSATTHIDLVQRAIYAGVPYRVIHNTSIMTAVGSAGLSLYEFGRTISIPFWDEFGKPTSFFDKIEVNLARCMHTLCLLDIKVKEQNLENLVKGNKIFEPPRYMLCQQAVRQLMDISRSRHENKQPCFIGDKTWAIGVSKAGSTQQRIALATLRSWDRAFEKPFSALAKHIGKPLHSIIICGLMQPMEIEFYLACVENARPDTNYPVVFLDEEETATTEHLGRLSRLLNDYARTVEGFAKPANAEGDEPCMRPPDEESVKKKPTCQPGL